MPFRTLVLDTKAPALIETDNAKHQDCADGSIRNTYTSTPAHHAAGNSSR